MLLGKPCRLENLVRAIVGKIDEGPGVQRSSEYADAVLLGRLVNEMGGVGVVSISRPTFEGMEVKGVRLTILLKLRP
ncbi:hypothetical protein Tco_0931542 [Tanacetum coccineum]